MTKQQWSILTILVMGVVSVYCIGVFLFLNPGKPTETIASIATPIPPTVTERPTATEMATATRVIPVPLPTTTRVASAFASSDLLALAWNKTAAVKSYRFEITFTSVDPLGWATGTPSPNPILVYHMAGIRYGKDQQVALRGFVNREFGGDATKDYETITVGDKFFIKGPLPSFGVTDERWYTTDKTKSPVYLLGGDLFSPIDPKKDSSGLYKIRTEKFDNRQCDVYSGDKVGLAKFLLDPDHQTPPGINNVEIADMQFWICNDGFLHQVIASDPGTQISNSQKLTTRHFYDFNLEAKIVAPANAAPLSNLMNRTATPTPKH